MKLEHQLRIEMLKQKKKDERRTREKDEERRTEERITEVSGMASTVNYRLE